MMNTSKSLLSILFLTILLACEDDRLQKPEVYAEPSSLALSSQQKTADVFLLCKIPYDNPWEIIYQPEWLNITPQQGNIFGVNMIRVTALTDNLLIGKMEDKITITTASNQFDIPVTLEVTESNAVRITPEELLLNFDENNKPITLTNFSKQSVNWQLTPSASYLNVTPASGSLGPNQSANLTVNVNRSTLDSKVYLESLSLKVGNNKLSDYPVTISNLLLLQSQVIDAEYDRTGDQLIVVTSDSKLLKIKSETNTYTTLSLPKTPTCVSVGTDGKRAVVGHDGWISLVDIANMSVEKSYAVSAKALDVVLAPNFWAYVFPTQDQWTYIRCINLETGVELLQTGRQIYAGTKGKLHPSGNYIYGANNGLSPSDAEKYDIQNGQAVFLYDSPYHGEYAFSGDLWISDDGTKMYTRSRNTFRLSTYKELDMIYGGTLEVDNTGMYGTGIKSLDHITSKNRVAAIMYDSNTATPDDEVRIYTADFLNFIKSMPLSEFIVNSASGLQYVSAEGHFVFFNTAGTKLVVIMKSAFVNNAEPKWAVSTINLN